MRDELVLVTGGSGFIGAHCVRRVLEDGYRVRTTVRSERRENDVRAMAGHDNSRLSFARADLLSDQGWAEAVEGCDFVLHVASPVPLADPRDEDDLIVPARDGALRVLKHARAASVKRTVLTSSFAAVKSGHSGLLTEEYWSDPSVESMAAYGKSKLFAERAAWDYVREHGGMELAVINPVGVFGPPLGTDTSLWADLLDQMLTGRLRAMPRMHISVVDVRDVADLHVRAMTNPAAAGERFLASAGMLTLPEIADLLRASLGERAARVPTRTMPNWTVRLLARVNRQAAMVVPELSNVRLASNQKARDLLDWNPRPAGEAVLAMAERLLAA